MVHGLAAQLGGALTIDSAPGQGTNVALWLPISTDLPDQGRVPEQLERPENPLGVALLVDDEDLVRMSTAHMLMDLGYDVVETNSGESALQMVQGGLTPDLLVTDHLMPGMTGARLVRKMKALRPSLRALIVSGYAEADGIDPDITRLTKPFRSIELAESLSTLASKK